MEILIKEVRLFIAEILKYFLMKMISTLLKLVVASVLSSECKPSLGTKFAPTMPNNESKYSITCGVQGISK